MLSKTWSRALSLSAALVYVAANLPGQTGQGTIVGLVSDSSGARIVSVGVRVTNRDTNVASAVTSNEGGLYRVSYLNPGRYDLVFESAGFKKLLRSDIEVRAAETVTIDIVLDVGAVTESIEVRAAAALLETETSSTGHLVTIETWVSDVSPVDSADVVVLMLRFCQTLGWRS